MTGVLAGSFTISGAHGVLTVLALILFGVAAVVAWVVTPRAIWATFVAAGLFLLALAQLWT